MPINNDNKKNMINDINNNELYTTLLIVCITGIFVGTVSKFFFIKCSQKFNKKTLG